MLGIYEKRYFSDGEKIWIGRYQNLTNILHWHTECEIIRIVEGMARIRIGDFSYMACKGDCFFCSGEELHHIISESDAQVEVAIFDESLLPEITGRYCLVSPKLPSDFSISERLENIKKELLQKEPFYRNAIEGYAIGLMIDVFRHCPLTKRDEKGRLYQNLITKINNEFSFITFEDAVRYSGYSASHFSKTFHKLAGMSFSEYLNIIKVENAIAMLRRGNATMTSVSQKCGFTTIRNFNRVFKKVTGYAPLSLPKDYTVDMGLHISRAEQFDPTDKAAILI